VTRLNRKTRKLNLGEGLKRYAKVHLSPDSWLEPGSKTTRNKVEIIYANVLCNFGRFSRVPFVRVVLVYAVGRGEARCGAKCLVYFAARWL